jgi:predicted hotdog family 3-hydroxylacyl-ACP dehydratase
MVELNRQWIGAHIPHQGAMCLLDEVLDWSAAEIRCRTSTHRLTTNPLRTGNRLRAVCGIEYAAQAMAIHGALAAAPAGATPRAGMLASVRSVELQVDRLDDIDSDLVVRCARLGGDDSALLYEFSVSWDLRVLLSGRGTIFLKPAGNATHGASVPS